MANEILSYPAMCHRESASLQRGMNFRLSGTYSVILMSLRRNAPYRDKLEDGGSTLIYEGHDAPRSPGVDSKKLDQPERSCNGSLTQNGKFFQAAMEYKAGDSSPHPVRVYEKIREGIWSYNGLFHLVDAWRVTNDQRSVFKFRLIAVPSSDSAHYPEAAQFEPRRVIPTAVKLAVWARDKGRCQICGATDELHFDHDLPYSKGGTSLCEENVRILCARHNLRKGARIQ